ncbi:hypothetical protein DRQ36_04830 [bacterium]|nr:MAG: hypothetical protein DRQ36_04830 [bacterium]
MKNKSALIILICSSVLFALQPMTLDDCFSAALENSPNVKAAQERISQAQAQVIQARSAFLPSISATASYTRLDTEPYVSMGDMTEMMGEILAMYIPPELWPPDTGQFEDTGDQTMKMGEDENYDITVGFRQPVFAGFGILSGYRLANLNRKIEGLNADNTREELLYSVEEAYWQHIKAQGFLQTAKQSLEQVSAHVADLEILEEQGVVSPNNVLEAQVQESEMELTVLKAQQAVRLTLLVLSTLTGISADSIFIEPEIPEKTDPFENSSEALKAARSGNTNLKTLDMAWKAADIAITAAASPLYPAVAVIGNWHYKKPNRELENDWYDSWDITAAVSLNVFDWGLTIGRIKEAVARKRELEANRETVTHALDLQVKTAYSTYIEAVAAEEVARKQVESARENYRITQELFANQAATSTMLLDAHSGLLRAEVNHLTANADRAIAKAALTKLTGGYIKFFREEEQ